MSASVTGRINMIKQPYGGYIKPSKMKEIKRNDNIVLNSNENIDASNVGLVVDYLTRMIMSVDELPDKSIEYIRACFNDAFSISLIGYSNALKAIVDIPYSFEDIVNELCVAVSENDIDNAIICACKIVVFDIFYRNIANAFRFLNKLFDKVVPDADTIHNIRTMISRSIAFFTEYGPITKHGFTFEPPESTAEDYKIFRDTCQQYVNIKRSFGGYTETVCAGDGDFLTHDTIWEFKVSRNKPTNKHTLQLLMYYIMGKHSGQSVYKTIKNIGIFNPRLNTVYIFDISTVPIETIQTVEKDVIGYEV